MPLDLGSEEDFAELCLRALRLYAQVMATGAFKGRVRREGLELCLEEEPVPGLILGLPSRLRPVSCRNCPYAPSCVAWHTS